MELWEHICASLATAWLMRAVVVVMAVWVRRAGPERDPVLSHPAGTLPEYVFNCLHSHSGVGVPGELSTQSHPSFAQDQHVDGKRHRLYSLSAHEGKKFVLATRCAELPQTVPEATRHVL